MPDQPVQYSQPGVRLTPLPDFPNPILEDVTIMGNHQFIALPRDGSMTSDDDKEWPGYRVYNALEDKWSELESFHRGITLPTKVVYGARMKTLYISCTEGWFTLNLKNKTIDSFPLPPPLKSYPYPSMVEVHGSISL